MVQDAEKFADQDAKRKELIEATNAAESNILDVEKNLTQFAAQLDASEADKVRALIKQVREVFPTAESAQVIKEKVDELQQASMNLFQMVYQKKMNENKDNKPEDAEFTDKK